MSHSASVEVRGQDAAPSFLLPTCGCQGLKFRCQVWQQESLGTEPSCLLCFGLFSFFKKSIYLFCVGGCTCMCYITWVWGSEDNLRELASLFQQVCPRDQTQVVTFSEKQLYPPSNFASSLLLLFISLGFCCCFFYFYFISKFLILCM